MAKRTKEQNAAIYRRRNERAKAKGTTYAAEKRAQDKARAREKALRSFTELTGTRDRAEYVVDRLAQTHVERAGSVDGARELAGSGIKEAFYHLDWTELGL